MTDREPSSKTTGLSDDEVSNDAIQLVTVSVFNGLCRTISALAANGLFTAEQLDGIHDAMTTPLDDPDLRDDDFITFARETVEKALAARQFGMQRRWMRTEPETSLGTGTAGVLDP